MHLPLRFCFESPVGLNVANAFLSFKKCIHMILWIANPLCDDTACWHAALRVLRAEAAKNMCLFSPLDSEKMNSTFLLLDLRIYVSDLAVLILTNLAVLASWGGSKGGGNWEPCIFFGKHRKENGEPLPRTPPPQLYEVWTTLCASVSLSKRDHHV